MVKTKSKKDLLNTVPIEGRRDAKQIIVDGREIYVHDGSFIMALRRENLRKRMIQELPTLIKKYGYAEEEQTALIMFYPPMTACSTCEEGLFTPLEFLTLKEIDVDLWYRTVNEVNPHWFPKPEEELGEQALKKKET